MKPALNEIPLPKYIAIEGPIGVGKTTLANKIAETFNYDAFLEQPAENPFLKNFYRNPSQSALATQLFFLFQRMQQIQDLKQRSLFENVRVADFLIEKDRLKQKIQILFRTKNTELDRIEIRVRNGALHKIVRKRQRGKKHLDQNTS